MRPFAELGALIEGRWRDHNYNDSVFPEIASQALAESRLAERVDPWEVLRWVHTTAALPQQQDPKGKFGDPPVTVFNAARFYIDVYYWLDGTTSIHQHAFSGAFQVLLGSSVHSHYRFEQRREINPYFLIGDVRLENVSLLTKGCIKKICPGPDLIHSLFHLERPSATITVRSTHSPQSAIQYNYLKPHFAVDPFFHDGSLTKKVQTVSLLLSMKHPDADRFIGDLLDAGDFHTSFSVLETTFEFLSRNALERMFQLSKSADRFDALLARTRCRHGDIAGLIPAVLEEQHRQRDIARRRGMIDGGDHRFFLALLLNAPERAIVLDLIRERFPNADPVELATGWIKELAAVRIFGLPEPNVLGLEGFEEGHLVVFDGLLRGLSREEIKARTETRPRGVPEAPVDAIIDRIKASPLFMSIFANS